MATGLVIILAVFIAVQRLEELRVAARNRAWALASGAREFGAGHYWLFVLLHSGWLIGWVVEAFVRGPQLSTGWFVWLALFVAAQGLRYWAITSLGPYWNTRILVIPGHRLVRRGPYRYLSHPNYVAVTIELVSVPLIFGAWITAVVVSFLNASLLLGVRIPTEKKALQRMRPEQ